MSIFSRALERSPETIDVQESLFNLGGHSLMATVVTSALQREFGLELSIETFFNNPSIQGLANIVTKHLEDNPNEPSDNTTPLVLDINHDLIRVKATIIANTNHHGPILFLFPEAGGMASVYSFAFQHIMCKVIAFGDPHWGLPRQEGEMLESAAHEWFEQVLLHQQNGPFFLGGWSYGGYLAHEVAIQLQNAGKTVAMVLMLDPAIDPLKRRRNFSWKPDLDHLLNVVDDRDRWLAQFRRVSELVLDYTVPQKYRGRAILVKALGGWEPAPPEDPYNGWLSYLPQIEVIGFDSSHRQMINPE